MIHTGISIPVATKDISVSIPHYPGFSCSQLLDILYLPFILPSRSDKMLMSLSLLSAGCGLFAAVNAAPFVIPFNDVQGRLEVQGHRGGLGLRTEASLWVSESATCLGCLN